MKDPTTFGPYAAERDTYDTPLNRAWLRLPVDHQDLAAQVARSHDLKLEHLVDACAAAGVELGEYDALTLSWLAGFPVGTVQVFIGLIGRAYAAGRAAAAADNIAQAWPPTGKDVDLLPRCSDHEGRPLDLDCSACAALRRQYYRELEQGDDPANATVLPEHLRQRGGGDR